MLSIISTVLQRTGHSLHGVYGNTLYRLCLGLVVLFAFLFFFRLALLVFRHGHLSAWNKTWSIN